MGLAIKMEALYFDWQIQFKPSWLCLKQKGSNKAIVVRISPDPKIVLGNKIARMSEAWVNGVKVYDPVDEYKVGQVLEL